MISVPFFFLPIVERKYSIEFFNIFSFIFVVQSVIMIFEIGLTNVLVKSVGDLRKNDISKNSLQTLIYSILIYIFGIFVIISVIILLNSSMLLLNFSLQVADHLTLLFLLAIGMLRFVASIPRIVLYGFEEYFSCSLIVSASSIMRFALPVLLVTSSEEINYFLLLMVSISCMEVLALLTRMSKFVNFYPYKGLKVREIKILYNKYAALAVNTFIPSLLWILNSQGDKLLLARIDRGKLDFGYIVAVSTLSSGVLIFMNSLNSAFMPRISSVRWGSFSFHKLFRINLFIGSIVLTIIYLGVLLFGDLVLFMWFQDWEFANNYANLFKMYVLLNIVYSFHTYCYLYLFYANNLVVHLISNILFTCGLAILFFYVDNLMNYLKSILSLSLIMLIGTAIYCVCIYSRNRGLNQ